MRKREPSNANAFLGILLSVCLGASGIVRGAESSDAGTPRTRIIKAIDIKTTRVREHVIRRELAFAVGKELTADNTRETKENLFRLGLLKSLEIRDEWDETLNGVRVSIEAEDGWFMLPWPMVGSQGGEQYAMLTFMEHNYFRESENIVLTGIVRDDELSGMLILAMPHSHLMLGAFTSTHEEYVYTDGAFSTKDFDSSTDDDEPEDFGTIANSYDKELTRNYVRVGIPIGRDFKASIGAKWMNVSYAEPRTSEPEDEGNLNAWIMSLRWGEGAGSGSSGGFAGVFGRIFGLGMAQVKDRLKPLAKIKIKHGWRLTLEKGEETLGSDEDYALVEMTLGQSIVFRNRSRLSLSTHGAWGSELPESLQLATTRQHGLKGVYAREYRGEGLVSVSGSFRQPFFRTLVGVLQAEAFAEHATVWLDDEDWDKQGVGVSLAYRFSRFPLPLGMSYTHCLDDDDGQVSFALGGMF